MNKKYKKKKAKSEEPLLFPELNNLEDPQDKYLRDELNIALLPFVHFPGKRQLERDRYEKTIYIDENKHVKLISSPSGGGIPEGPDLDYFYALIELLYDQTKFKDDTIYFFVTELIRKAGRHASQDEIKRAIRAVRRFRHLVIQSNATKSIDEKGRTKFVEKDISYIQEFIIVGDLLKKGRRSLDDTTNGGKCKVVFTKYFMINIISKELSKPLNYSLMKKINSSKGKRLFRMIDAFRYSEASTRQQDGLEIVVKDIYDIARRIPLTELELTKLAYIKRSIEPSLNELKKLFYLKDFFYERTEKAHNIVWVFSHFKTDQASAYNELIMRGITPNAAEMLAIKHTDKIMDVLQYCDYLKKENPAKITPGYIRTTIENSDINWIRQYNDKREEQQREERMKDAARVREKMRMLYDVEVENAIDRYIKEMPNERLREMKDEIGKELQRNPGRPSSKKAIETTIDGYVRQRVLPLIDIPDFEIWLTENKEKYFHLI